MGITPLQPDESRIGDWITKKWHLNAITCTSDWMESQVFPVADNRCQDSRKSHDRLGCGTDQSQDGYFKSYWPREAVAGCRSVVQDRAGGFRFVQKIYRVTSVFLCGVSLISLWNRSSSYMYNANYSVFLIQISFHIYMHAWCVSCNKGKHNAAWLCESVIVAFISLWKLKFLAYMLNVTQRFVMRIISYANIVYFIFI